MKNKKGIVIMLLTVLAFIYIYFVIFTNNFDDNIIMNYLALVFIIVIGFYMISLIYKKDKKLNFKSKDKLFNSLVENSDTIYIMMNSSDKKIMYLSDNIEDVLGIKRNDKSDDKFVFEILNLPIIKAELDNWDKTSEYVSQMIAYDNPKYNHQMWIKVKIYLYKEKKEEYLVIQIANATKEHDRQHLLISQATDIKTRENQLDQITASSYDMEMNVNLNSNTYDLKYFKKDNMYFGEEKKGTYTDGIKELINTYVNDSDREEVLKVLDIEFLKDRVSKFELDSISIRYRIGNELKNNTWLESTIFFLSNRQKSMVSILTKNVTENAESIREQNIQLQNALNEAKVASNAKTDLISTISHDIRIPLTNIMGLSEALLRKSLNDDLIEDIKTIKLSSQDVLSIIDGLLDTSKIEKRLIEKEEKQYSILKTFKILENSAKEYIGTKNINIVLNLDNNLPIILIGDYKRITQALRAVIENSVKYTDEGEIRINVRGEKQDNNVNLIIEIMDTGTGIPEDKLNTIMNSNATKGLGAVKNLMKLLDGKFEMESKLGEYTKTTISFVQKIAKDNKVREMINNNKAAEEFSLKGHRILIVDDNKLNLKVTSRLLEPYELEVVLLETGIECIELLKEQKNFDLIMMDQMMPGMDGVATLNKLKELAGFNIPVVVLTADAIEGQKEKYLANGFSDYISKPIDKGELSRVLKKFLKNQ